MLKKTIYIVGFFLIFIPFLGYSQNKNLILYSQSSPIVISLKNLQNETRWQLDKNASVKDSITIDNFREGYIYSYFTLKLPPSFKGQVTFFAFDKEGKKIATRTFNLQPDPKPNQSGNPLFGDVPSQSRGDGFLDQANNPSPERSQEGFISPQDNHYPVDPATQGAISQFAKGKDQMSDYLAPEPSSSMEPTPVPEKVKAYIQNLLNAGLFSQARAYFDQYLKIHPTDDTEYQILTDIKISEGLKDYQKIVDAINALLNPDGSFKEPFSADLQFNLRNELSQALEKLNKPQDAETQLIYLKTFEPNNPFSYYYLGQFYLRHQQMDKAIAQFTVIINEYPDFDYIDEIYFQIGNYYYSVIGVTGYHLAINYFKKILDIGLSSSYYNQAQKIVTFLESNFLNN